MQRLKKGHSTLIVDKWERSTGVCPDCGHILEQKLGLDERRWRCPACGAEHDRDVASARYLLEIAMSFLDEYRREVVGEEETQGVRFGDQTVIRQLSSDAQAL